MLTITPIHGPNPVADWVCAELDCGPQRLAVTLAIVDIETQKPVGGLLLTDFTTSTDDDGNEYSEVQFCIHVDTPKWCNRRNLRAIFSYAFNVMGLHRITTLAQVSNKRANKLNHGLKFVHEGVLRKAIGGEDVNIYSMLKDECPWTKENYHG